MARKAKKRKKKRKETKETKEKIKKGKEIVEQFINWYDLIKYILTLLFGGAIAVGIIYYGGFEIVKCPECIEPECPSCPTVECPPCLELGCPPCPKCHTTEEICPKGVIYIYVCCDESLVEHPELCPLECVHLPLE